MYEGFYNFTGRPFKLTPDPKFWFDSRTHKKAMAYLTYGLNQGEGFIIITGDIGAGKTTLVGHLFDTLDLEEYVLATVTSTQLEADDLLRMVVSAFGLDSDDNDKAKLLGRIERFLRAQYEAGRRVLLIVDEAQNLNVGALEELRMLSNFQIENRALMQSFLLGQPEFRDKLAFSPELEQLRQRVIATHHLEPMAREELDGYIEHRLKLVGWTGTPSFEESAIEAIYEYSQGVPRRLNTLCSRILLFGGIEELTKIDKGVVADVVADLESDATPTTGPKYVPQADTQSGTGPIAAQSAGNVTPLPTKMDSGVVSNSSLSNIDMEDIIQLNARLALIEQYVEAHDISLRKLVDIMGMVMKADKGSGNGG